MNTLQSPAAIAGMVAAPITGAHTQEPGARLSCQSTLPLGLLLIIASSHLAYPAVVETAPRDLRLRVFVLNAAQVPDATLWKAQEIASLVYQRAGIRLDWFECPPGGGEKPDEYPDCQGPYSLRDLFLRIVPIPITGLRLHDTAFAFAVIPPSGLGVRAFIYYDRVNRWTADWLRRPSPCFIPVGDLRAATLGVVMAHELGHLLLGSHSHSTNGIMSPNWGHQALEEAYAGRRGFSPDQQKRLRDKVQARPAGVPSNAASI